MSRITLIAAAAAGYVLGSRAGRGHYEVIKEQALKLWQTPQVQEAASQATEVAKDTAEQVKDQAAEALGQDGDESDSGGRHSTDRAQPSSQPSAQPTAQPSTAQNLYPGGADGSAAPS